MKRLTLHNAAVTSAISMATLAVVGCSVDVYSPPPRQVVIEQSAPPDQEVVVTEAPPTVVYEAAPPPPEVGVIWIQPEYVLVGGRYELRHGHWDHPPQGHNRWVASHYEHGPRGYIYVSGRWD
jgi:hypothetical protein